jgi:hypothetical protein
LDIWRRVKFALLNEGGKEFTTEDLVIALMRSLQPMLEALPACQGLTLDRAACVGEDEERNRLNERPLEIGAIGERSLFEPRPLNPQGRTEIGESCPKAPQFSRGQFIHPDPEGGDINTYHTIHDTTDLCFEGFAVMGRIEELNKLWQS